MAATVARKSLLALRFRQLALAGQSRFSHQEIRSYATKHSFPTDKDDKEREQLAKEISEGLEFCLREKHLYFVSH